VVAPEKRGAPRLDTGMRRRMPGLHRTPARFGRLGGWVEGLPEVRLYAALALTSWVSLTLLVGLGSGAPVERAIVQGFVEQEALSDPGSPNLPHQTSPWTALLGVALVVAVEMGMAWYFLRRFGARIFKDNAATRLVLTASLMILFTALARLFLELGLDPYLTPLAGLSIIGTMLLGPRLTFLMAVMASVNVGIMGGNDFLLSSALLLVSGFAVYAVVRVGSRQQLLGAGLVVAGAMAAVAFAVGLIGGASFPAALWLGALGFGNGLLSLGLALVLLPLLEDAFNVLTPMKLLEISDPGTPLMMRLLERAPGTFTHSILVGVLAENAAERIGANAMLARGGGYYHDIGKMEHPAYFIENQIARANPHANLSPALSARIIKRHVEDGLKIGRAWGLPQEILDIIAQHHGTTRIEYFYRKALEESAEVGEADFRYNTGLPRSKEAGIVMLADSVEATVKALSKPTPERVEDVVRETIKRKLDDGQLDACELTVREIHQVGDAIREALTGFLGPRIQYPDGSRDPNGARPKGGQTAKPATRTSGEPG